MLGRTITSPNISVKDINKPRSNSQTGLQRILPVTASSLKVHASRRHSRMQQPPSDTEINLILNILHGMTDPSITLLTSCSIQLTTCLKGPSGVQTTSRFAFSKGPYGILCVGPVGRLVNHLGRDLTQLVVESRPGSIRLRIPGS